MSFVAPPPDDALAALLERVAPLVPAPLCPELHVHRARSLVEVWEAAERLAGATLPSPFWAWPWPAGCAIARVLLDAPERVRGRRVVDVGAGGGVASLAAMLAGAAAVTAVDVDPWALAVARLTAARQSLRLDLVRADPVADPTTLPVADLLICADLGYERAAAPAERALVQHARAIGMDLLIANAGRMYFVEDDLVEIAAWDVEVPEDLEGIAHRRARVFEPARG